jgi:hypothetical protein
MDPNIMGGKLCIRGMRNGRMHISVFIGFERSALNRRLQRPDVWVLLWFAAM